MLSIMDAVEAAQKRSMQRDDMNRLRVASPSIQPTEAIAPIMPIASDDNDDGGLKDTRTPREMYVDAVRTNKFAAAFGPLASPIQLMNDAYIQKYEAENPNNILPGQRYSTLGRILGFGDPGSTGITGVFGENRDLYDAGFFDLSEEDQRPGISLGYRGDAYRAETGGGIGPAQSGPSF